MKTNPTKLKWAIEYLNYAVNQGVLSEDSFDLDTMTDKEIVTYANTMEQRSDSEYTQRKENKEEEELQNE